MTDEPRRPKESRNVAPTNGAPKVEKPKPPQTKLGRELYNLISDLSMAFLMAGDTYCSALLADNAASLATAWDNLSKKNDRVKRTLEMLTSGGAYGHVTFATLAVALPMAQHHGIYPQGWPLPMSLGLVPPPPSEEVREHEQTRRPPSAGYPGPADESGDGSTDAPSAN